MRLKFVLAAILLFEILGCSKSSQPAGQLNVPRNVYIITATGLRADHLSSYLYQSTQTPGLDYLAYDGIRFTRAFSTSTDSLPAHLSIFTGLSPVRNSIFETYRYFQTFTAASFPNSMDALPKLLRTKGYRTAAFAADPDLRAFVLRSGWFDTTYAGDSILPLWQPSSDSDRVRLQATEWSLSMSNSPHFVFLNFFEPTPPYEPPVPYSHHYTSHPYDGEIAALDEQISLFVHMLKQAGLFEHSIVIFAAPYGENPEGAGRAGSLEDSNLKIPMMIAAPGLLPRQQKYLTAVSLVDLYPTVVALLNSPGVSNIDGTALFEKNSNRQITHEFLSGGSFFPYQLGMEPYRYAWSDGWKWTSNTRVVKREEGLPDHSTPEQLLQKEAQLRAKLQELTNLAGGRASLPAGGRASLPAEGGILQLEEAYVLAQSGKFLDALKSLSDPPLPETPFVLSFLSALQDVSGHLGDSLKTLRKAMQLPNQPELLLRLADLEIRAGKIQPAESSLKAYHGVMSYDIYSMMSIIDMSNGRPDQAQADIDTALKLNPRSAEAHRQQGLIFFARGEYARAESVFRKALELRPDNKDTILDLAATLAKLGKRDEVKRLCAAVLIQSPTPELQKRAREILAE